MTVADLIAKLQALDPNVPVVVGGFDEWGYDALETVRPISLVPVAPQSHGPDFQEAGDRLPASTVVTGKPFAAILLDRKDY